MCRRDRQRAGEVVEAAVRGLVAWQERLHVEVDRKEVPNRVVVFRPIEAMDGANSSCIRMRCPRAVELGFEQSRECLRNGGIGARSSRWWHRALLEPGNDFFP